MTFTTLSPAFSQAQLVPGDVHLRAAVDSMGDSFMEHVLGSTDIGFDEFCVPILSADSGQDVDWVQEMLDTASPNQRSALLATCMVVVFERLPIRLTE
jgi:hypothetical protein